MGYSEYNMWHQPKCNITPIGVTLNSEINDDFISNELKMGLERIWGELQDGKYTITLKINKSLENEEYSLMPSDNGFEVAGGGRNGALYGVYRLVNLLSTGKGFDEINEKSAPKVSHRVINHWDNMNGSIERGYAGRSIFYDNNEFCCDKDRIVRYARLLASVGINTVCINNVNVDRVSVNLITQPLLSKAAELADLFRPFGIRLSFSVSFDAPVTVGKLQTPDPLDEDVIKFWQKTADEIYSIIPDFAGFTVKADSEFRDGPASFGRTQADGANTMAKALKKHNGIVFWRCFIYNCRQDWRDTKTDRPMAAYNTFKPLDGKFEDNVILQIKFGPVDFQVREPLSPLFSALDNTKEAIEYQIAQEYTGHQIDIYNLAVQWQEINAETAHNSKTISDMFGDEITAAVAVSNIGKDSNWTGHTMSQCNLYAFGRMAWNPKLTAEEITEEWISLTFETDKETKEVIFKMLMQSRSIYESYTSPLGIGFMVTRNSHYGPDVEGYEYAKWGTYHRANFEAVGVDRTAKGTGYTNQYPSDIQKMYDDVTTCPEELLLFFHRVRYDYIMKNGKTMLQNIYDSHFDGALKAQSFLTAWDGIKDKLPEETYNSVRSRLVMQAENANEWCDVINTYFYRLTGTPDEKKRTIYN